MAGSAWELERDAYHFHGDALIDALAGALGMNREAARKWFGEAGDQLTLGLFNPALVLKFLPERLNYQAYKRLCGSLGANSS